MVNGSLLIQQGAYAATRNPNARVRLAAAVSGGARVAASASDGTVIDAGSVAPAFSFAYTLVPAKSTLNISVNGQSVGAPATALVAGGDATLLVYGNAANPTATLITDDNRPPTDPTTTKLRLINGITGSAGLVTLTANTAVVGNNIGPGAASNYASVIGSTNAMNLALTSSSGPGVQASPVLGQNSVYTVLAGGDSAAPQLLVR